MQERLTARLKDGMAVLTDWSIHGQAQAREKLCRLEEMMAAGALKVVNGQEMKRDAAGVSEQGAQTVAAGKADRSGQPAAGMKTRGKNAAKSKETKDAG